MDSYKVREFITKPGRRGTWRVHHVPEQIVPKAINFAEFEFIFGVTGFVLSALRCITSSEAMNKSSYFPSSEIHVMCSDFKLVFMASVENRILCSYLCRTLSGFRNVSDLLIAFHKTQ